MPDEKGVLSPDETTRFVEWIQKHWRTKVCPICQRTQWNIANRIVVHSAIATKGGMILGSLQSYPHILMTCTVCGYTMHFNAVIAGILKKGRDDG